MGQKNSAVAGRAILDGKLSESIKISPEQVNQGKLIEPKIFPHKPLPFKHDEENFSEAVGLNSQSRKLLQDVILRAFFSDPEARMSPGVEKVEKILMQADPEMIRFIVADYCQLVGMGVRIGAINPLPYLPAGMGKKLRLGIA